MNGLVDKYYYTSHVTPEDHCSFASVETCVPVKELCQRMGTCLSSSQYLQYKSMGNVVEKIVDIYRPSSFSVVLFVNTAKSNYYSGRGSITTTCNWNNKNNNLSMLDGVLGAEELNKFELADRVSHNLGKWHVEFMHFEPKAAKCSASATTRRRQIHI